MGVPAISQADGGSLGEDVIEQLGQKLLLLHSKSRDWVSLRHDSVELMSDAVALVRSRVWVDCTKVCATLGLDGTPACDGSLLLPIACIRREFFISPEVRSADGCLVKSLPRHRSRRLLRAGVVGLARTRLENAPLSDWVQNWILEADPVDFGKLASTLATYEQVEDLVSQVEQLRADDAMRVAARTASCEMLVVPVAPTEHEHMFTYQMQRTYGALPVRPFDFGIRFVNVDVTPLDAERVAYDIHAPVGLAFTGRHAEYVSEFLGTASEPAHRVARRLRVVTRTVVSHEIDPSELAKQRTIRAEISLPVDGIVRSGKLSVVSTLVTLCIGLALVLARFPNRFPGSEDASVAILLVVVGFAGPLLAERAPHPLTSSVQRQTRYVLYGVFAAAYAAAGAVALGSSGWLGVGLWAISVAVTGAGFVLLRLQCQVLKAIEAESGSGQ